MPLSPLSELAAEPALPRDPYPREAQFTSADSSTSDRSASSSSDSDSSIDGRIVWEHVVPAGTHWSGQLRRGLALRVIDLEGGANVSAVFYRHDAPLERYNMADTLKAQHTAHLTRGFVLYSDMGRVMASIVVDTLGWHDPLSGVGDAALFERKYGVARYQEHRNAMIRNGRDSLLVELGKHGLGARDLVANINFFSKVIVGDDGALRFVSDHSRAGDHVDLRFEMHTLVALSSAPHPLDPDPVYAPKSVKLIAYEAYRPGERAPADDPCRNARAENTRGFINTDMLYA
ncbi:urea amidolyase associated protein UAAP1 [Pararobbsia silviterrae]|uniref:Urea carboxylase-associated family protein n=1 Tax=Pararobbsia silviterrae TaxID=1792498 RepID=A0A494XMB8_9BURK|nr:urea amidolyase associated protein UAAP1 [Pararobbsia silviterrae]RKP48683.1 urea carboxylase-associated family protein [Pararobbsia silviterrae]